MLTDQVHYVSIFILLLTSHKLFNDKLALNFKLKVHVGF